MRLFRCIVVLGLLCCVLGWADPPPGPTTYDQLVDREAAFTLTNAPRVGALPAQETKTPVPVSADGTARHDDTTANRVFIVLLYLLQLIAFVVVPGLAISAIFTKEGRARFDKGKFPEAFLMLVLYAIISLFLAGMDDRTNSRSSRADNGRKPRRGGTFDGGGASGNW